MTSISHRAGTRKRSAAAVAIPILMWGYAAIVLAPL